MISSAVYLYPRFSNLIMISFRREVRKKSIVEKNNKNKEVYSMLDNRQKILLFMAAEDMVVNGLNSTKKMVLASSYDKRTACGLRWIATGYGWMSGRWT